MMELLTIENLANLAIVGPLTFRELRHRRAATRGGHPNQTTEPSLSSEAAR